MRIRRVDVGGNRPRSISFHPQVTVVRGLRGPHRQQLIDAVDALPDGTVTGVSGEVEVDGEMLPLDGAALRPNEASHDRLNNVVRASQLPGANGPAGRRSPRRAAEMSRDGLARRLAGARSRLADAAARRVALLDEREEARRGEEAAGRMAAEAAAARDEASSELAAAQARRGAAAAELAEADAAHRILAEEPVPEEEALAQAKARHAAALDALAGAERSLAEAREGLDLDSAAPGAAEEGADGDPDATGGPEPNAGIDHAGAAPADRVDLLERRRNLEMALGPLAAVDPSPVADALRAVRAQVVETTEEAHETDGTIEERAEQGSLALDLVEAPGWPPAASELTPPEDAAGEEPPTTVDADPGPGESAPASAGASVQASLWEAEAAIAFEAELSEANARVEAAQAALAEAQAAAAAAAQLDPEAVTALEAAHAEVLVAQKSQGRFSRRARNRLEEALAAEQHVLRQHGFSGYAEFAMSLAPSSRFLENPAVAEARADVIAAEVALAALEAEAEAERRAEGEQSADLDLDGEEASWPSGRDAVAELRDALLDAGLAVDTTDDRVEDAAVLVTLAEHWLEEHAAAAARRLEIEAELAELEADLAQASVAPLAPEELAAHQAEATATRAAAERHLARHREAEARLAALVEEVDAGRDDVEATAAEVVAAEEALAGLDRTALDAAADAVARARAALADAEAAEHRAEERLAERERDAANGVAIPVDAPVSFEERLAAVTAAVEAAQAEVGLLEAELTAADRRLAGGDLDEEADISTSPAAFDEELEARIDEIEWYLMSRLASQRTTGAGGSVPILFDDAFAELPGEQAVRLAAGVERLAAAVQVVLLSDDEDLATWADGLGDERAVVVSAGLI